MFVVDVTPVSFADVCLISDYFFVDDGSVLDSAVDESCGVVTAEAEFACECEVLVFFCGGEEGVGRHFFVTV